MKITDEEMKSLNIRQLHKFWFAFYAAAEHFAAIIGTSPVQPNATNLSERLMNLLYIELMAIEDEIEKREPKTVPDAMTQLHVGSCHGDKDQAINAARRFLAGVTPLKSA